MKKWLFPLIILLSLQANAQLDSIQALISSAKNDTNKVNLYIRAFSLTKNSEPAKADGFAQRAIELANKLSFEHGQMNIYRDYGSFLDIQGRYDESQVNLDKGMVIAKKINDKSRMGGFAIAMGILEYDKGKFTDAHKLILQSLRYREEANDVKGIADSYVWLGVIHEKGMKKNDEALKYYRSALATYKNAGMEERMAYAYNNIGNVYYNINKFDSSLHYYLLSLDIKRKGGDPFSLGTAYNNIANLYTDMKNYPMALKYYDTALRYKEQAEDYSGLATHYVNVGLVYGHMKNYKEAEIAILKGLDLSKKNDFPEIILTAYEVLSQIAAARGDHKKAYEYHIEFAKRKDSAFNKDMAQQMADMQTKYETEKKDLDISKKDLELNKKQIQLGILIGSIVVIVILGYLFYNRYRLKKQQEMDAEIIRQRELRTKAIIEAEEQERIRIARELHDGVGQQISAVKLNMNAFADNIKEGTDNQEQYAAIMDMVDDAVKEVRSVSHNMMPNALIRFGLARAVREFIDKIAASGALKVNLQIIGLNDRLESTTETVLYRVMQETVNNIIKHAQASQISIQLIKDNDSLTMMIEDNGKGFDPRNISEFGGIGLKNIISRVEYLNGTVDFDSFPGKGTTVIVELHLNNSNKQET